MTKTKSSELIAKLDGEKTKRFFSELINFRKHLLKTAKGGSENPKFRKLSSFDGFFNRYIQHESGEAYKDFVPGAVAYQKQKDRHLAKYASLNKDELLEVLAETLIGSTMLCVEIERLRKDSKELADIAFGGFVSHLKADYDRQTGRARKYKSNNEFLDQCLEKLKVSKSRPLKSSDFSAYMNLVTQKAPPFKTKTGESAEDKELTDEDRKIHVNAKDERKAKVFNGWAEGTIRKRWEEKTGLKAALKKVSPLKQ